MHLLAQRDLDVLGAANAHFTSEVLDFIRDEPVKGNCYFWSAPDQPYVVGVRVDDYEKQANASVEAPRAVDDSQTKVTYDERLVRAVVTAICAEPRVYLYRVSILDGRQISDSVAVAPAYLASMLADAAELQALRPDDWEQRWERIALRAEVLEATLTRAGLSRNPPREKGVVERRESREMILVNEARLNEHALRLGLAVKTTREGAVELKTGR